MLEHISVVVAVYFPSGAAGHQRVEGFRKALASWDEHLLYRGEMRLVVVNDGAPLPLFGEWRRPQVSLGHTRNGLGASLNQGLQMAFESSHLALNIVDDAMLTEPYDLTPWARLLMDDEAVGAVHLSAPHPGTGGTIAPRGKPNRGGWVVTLDRHNLAAGLRPALYHKRFFHAYGAFDESLNAWETERLFNERFCRASGPDSVLALPCPWAEGKGSTVKLGQRNPKEV